MTTEKMLPEGFVPGKNECGKYEVLYLIPEFSLIDRINTLSLSALSEEHIAAICKRNPHDTGVGLEDPSFLWPVEKRYRLAHVGLEHELRELKNRETRFREASEYNPAECERVYKSLRTQFIRTVGQKVAFEYVKRELDHTTPEDREQQNEAYEAREKAWTEKQERWKKIYAIAEEHPGFVTDMQFDEEYFIDRYNLTEADLKEIDELLEEERKEARKRANIPDDHVERYDWRNGYYSVPIIAEKIRMIRKAAGLNQREFAKLIDYPNANKYGKFEKGELGSPNPHEKIEIIKNVCDATSANPYWLERDTEESLYEAGEEETARTANEADPLYGWPMYATGKVIREWWIKKNSERKRV